MSVIGSAVGRKWGRGRVGDAPWTPGGHSSCALGMACIRGFRGRRARLIESSCGKLEGKRRKAIMVLPRKERAKSSRAQTHVLIDLMTIDCPHLNIRQHNRPLWRYCSDINVVVLCPRDSLMITQAKVGMRVKDVIFHLTTQHNTAHWQVSVTSSARRKTV
jgi:hypothetical protein